MLKTQEKEARQDNVGQVKPIQFKKGNEHHHPHCEHRIQALKFHSSSVNHQMNQSNFLTPRCLPLSLSPAPPGVSKQESFCMCWGLCLELLFTIFAAIA